jgi:hypothetical protein
MKRSNHLTIRGNSGFTLSITFVVEAVYTIDAGALVIAAEDEKVFRVLDLVCEQETDRLQALLAPVHVVAKEKVIGLGWEATVLEEPQKIIVLPMNIAYGPKSKGSGQRLGPISLAYRKF